MTPLQTALACIAAYLVLVAIAAAAWRRARDRADRCRTADASQLDRDARRALRTASTTSTPRGDDFVSQARAERIRRHAHTTAQQDFQIGRRSANPEKRHTRAAGLWATEYEAAWAELSWAAGDNVIPLQPTRLGRALAARSPATQRAAGA